MDIDINSAHAPLAASVPPQNNNNNTNIIIINNSINNNNNNNNSISTASAAMLDATSIDKQPDLEIGAVEPELDRMAEFAAQTDPVYTQPRSHEVLTQ